MMTAVLRIRTKSHGEDNDDFFSDDNAQTKKQNQHQICNHRDIDNDVDNDFDDDVYFQMYNGPVEYLKYQMDYLKKQTNKTGGSVIKIFTYVHDNNLDLLQEFKKKLIEEKNYQPITLTAFRKISRKVIVAILSNMMIPVNHPIESLSPRH